MVWNHGHPGLGSEIPCADGYPRSPAHPSGDARGWNQSHRCIARVSLRKASATSPPLVLRGHAGSVEGLRGYVRPLPIGQHPVYGQRMLTIDSRLDVMNRLGRAMADPNRSRILLSLLSKPGYPAKLARELELSRTNVSNHLACLRGCGIVAAEPEGRQTRYEIADPHLSAALTELVDITLAIDEDEPCMDPHCSVPGCCSNSSNSGDANGELKQ